MIIRTPLLPLVFLVLSGCTQKSQVTPGDWVGPMLEKKPKFEHASAISEPNSEQQLNHHNEMQSVWTNQNDPTLTALLDAARQHNPDIHVALQNLALAKVIYEDARLDQVPQLRNSAAFLHQSDSQTQSYPANNGGDSYKDLRLTQSLSWTLDFFGRLKSASDAAQLELLATEQDLQLLYLVMQAAVAEQYFLVTGLSMQLNALTENVYRQQQMHELIEQQIQAGVATELDAARAQSLLYSSKARLIPIKTEQESALHRLSTLTGLSLETINQQLSKISTLPDLPNVSASLKTPERILKQRPDILAAEARLKQAYARIKESQALRYPSISLDADVGVVSDELGQLPKSQSLFHILGFRLNWAGFGMKRVNNRINQASVRALIAEANYQKTVLMAFEQIENSLVAFNNARENITFLQVSARAAKEASTFAQERYEGGLISFLEVLEAEKTRLELESQLAAAKTQQAIAAIDLLRQMATS